MLIGTRYYRLPTCFELPADRDVFRTREQHPVIILEALRRVEQRLQTLLARDVWR
jgi:hypothetical protein